MHVLFTFKTLMMKLYMFNMCLICASYDLHTIFVGPTSNNLLVLYDRTWILRISGSLIVSGQ